LKQGKLFDIFLYLGAFALTVAMIAVLFNLKWAQNARKLANEQAETAEQTLVNDFEDAKTADSDDLEIDTDDVDASDTEAEIISEEKGLVADENDVIFFLGGDFSKLQERFASSEQILGVKSHYFVDEYLGVVYDENTGEIMCLENDGPGKMPIKLAGLSIGMSREELYTLLDESEIEYTESEEDNTVKFNWHAGDTVKYKAEIEFEDERIIDIVCRVR